MTPAQCRGARALVFWTQDDLAEASGVNDATVTSFETWLKKPSRATVQVIRWAFEAAGVAMIDEDGRYGPGLQMLELNLPAQCRAARGLLDWTHIGLAEAAGVSSATVGKFEAEQVSPVRGTLRKIRRAFEAAGVIFVEENGKVAALRLRKGLR
jgi:DNA-binding XRE family transcriptional regulator